MPDYVRVSLGTKEEMDHYFEAMDKILPNTIKNLEGRLVKICRYQYSITIYPSPPRRS